MKIFSAFFATETNTSAVVPTGFADFDRIGVYRGDASNRDPEGFGASHVELKRLATADGHEVVESLTAFAHRHRPQHDPLPGVRPRSFRGPPGSITQNFAEMRYRNRDNNFWPRVADPRDAA